MVDIFDEVSEDLRNERALRLARRYGALLIGACLLVLLAVAAQQADAWYQLRQEQAAANQYLNLTGPLDATTGTLTPAQAQTAAAALSRFAATAPAGYRSLAALRAAALYAGLGQFAPAAALWNQLAGDTGADPLLRDLAVLLWVEHAAGRAPDAAVLARLQPLSLAANPLHALAQETQALLYLRAGQTGQAKTLFSQIAADPDAPEQVRNRADGLLAKLNG